jgi:hypothetical protein
VADSSNGAVVILLAAAVLTGMGTRHSAPARRHHATAASTSSPARIELGDARIPVTSGRHVPRGIAAPARPRAGTAAWHRSGPPTAETEPGVIVGYVGPGAGPGAFHRLAKVSQGDQVKLVRRDGRVSWFRVDSVRRPSRPLHPGGRTMRDTGRPELRLISWRGKGDRNTSGDPRDVVVSAHLVPRSHTGG